MRMLRLKSLQKILREDQSLLTVFLQTVPLEESVTVHFTIRFLTLSIRLWMGSVTGVLLEMQ